MPQFHYSTERIPLFVRLIVSTLSVFFAAQLLSGVSIEKFTTAIWVAVAIGFLNAFVRPILILFTLPATIFTFGLFLFVINALVVLMADSLISDGFQVKSFGWALLFSLFVSFFNGLMYALGGYRRTNKNDQYF
jgi:putative membrane protein